MTHNRVRPLNLPQPVLVTCDNRGQLVAVADSSRHSAAFPLCSSTCNEGQESAVMTEESKSIEAVIEVWRVDDEWWREVISRRYLEVVLEGGSHVVLYEDLVTGDWFMQMV